ncbi:MAG: hypothetical protein JOZ78_14800 [Chroococcidiopsidaceae cyanobacterium CP_BM_ER_R8_30]|nr:hypothetical protein [Chroococcidiopsidaceae cyanobacterium CP_BM_ER_R8_30]
MTNTSSSGDRLAQIEALLQQSVIASNERMTRLEQTMERDRQESNERMTRIERSIGQIEQLTQSNGRAIQALTEDITTFKLAVEQDREEAKAERQELRQVTMGIANLLSSLDSDRPTILRKLNFALG